MRSRIRIGSAAVALAMLATPALAVDVTECATMLEDDAARLACYDRIVMAEVKRQLDAKRAQDAPQPDPGEGMTLPLVPLPNPDLRLPPPAAIQPTKRAAASYKRVDPSDVRATPSKWADRDIEFATANIYWVSDDDLRVLTNENMTLFGGSAAGSSEDLAFLKENCETAKEALSAKCKIRVRFAYSEHSEDTPNGYAKRVVLRAPIVEMIRLQQARRRR